MKHILIAFDGSTQAHKAFDFAVNLAQKFHAEITVLSVIRPPDFPEDVTTMTLIETAQKAYEEMFLQLQKRCLALAPNLKTTYKTAVGSPADKIVSEAEALGIDHIVMGHLGQSLLQRWLLGSVAKQVMSYAPCPITIFK